MVLYPLPANNHSQPDAIPIPAWRAVERRQRQRARDWWLVAQPDHAALAGDLAARLDFPTIPALSTEVIDAISAHDAGWAKFDSVTTLTTASLKLTSPVSFLEICPVDFLVAWVGSINAAERIGTLGGIIVSEHFSRLGQSRLASRNDSAEDVSRLRQFLSEESARQARLCDAVEASASELEALTDVLQFCDLVSLYLCCGAGEPAEFPQQFDGTTIQVRRDGDAFLFTPPVFGRGASLGVSARRYLGQAQNGTIPFLVG